MNMAVEKGVGDSWGKAQLSRVVEKSAERPGLCLLREK